MSSKAYTSSDCTKCGGTKVSEVQIDPPEKTYYIPFKRCVCGEETQHTCVFPTDHYQKHDYGVLWRHVAITYECKECGLGFETEKDCKKHIGEVHGKG